MSNRFLYQTGSTDYARESTLEEIEDILRDGTLSVSLGSSALSTIDITKIDGNNVANNQGNADAGTLRMAICDDDTNLVAIKNSLDTIDNAIVGSTIDCSIDSTNITGSIPINIDQIVGSSIATNSGAKNGQCQRMVIATDDINLASINTSCSNSAGDISSINTLFGNSILASGSGINKAIAIGASNGSNLEYLASDGSGNLFVNLNGDSGSYLTNIYNNLINNYNIRKHNNSTTPNFEIYAEFLNFTASSYNNMPNGFNSSETNAMISGGTDVSQLDLASSSTSDNNLKIYIEGYNNSGSLVSETITLSGIDPRLSVTSSQSYTHVTKIIPQDKPDNINGIISCAITGTTNTSGNFDSCIIQIPSGQVDNYGQMSCIRLPDAMDLVIHQLEFSLIEGSSDQSLCLFKSKYSSNNIYGSFATRGIVNKWRVTSNPTFINYDAGWIIKNTSAVHEYYSFHVLGLNTESTGRIKVRCNFSFIAQ